MTDPSTISPEQAAAASPGQAAIEVTRQFFKFASDHYVIFSALTIIAVVFVCTVFTFGYLSVFYWRLILVLEYTDVLKAGFAAAAIFLTLAVFLFEQTWAHGPQNPIWRDATCSA